MLFLYHYQIYQQPTILTHEQQFQSIKSYLMYRIFIIYNMGRIINALFMVTVLALAFLTNSAEQPYKKIVHNTDPKAKCLDGSSPAVYLHEGGDTKNILIFFNNGGWCAGNSLSEVLDSCYSRSKTTQGSSTLLPDTLQNQAGYLSTDPAVSKFANWTKVFVTYCDGSFHQGSAQNPIKYKDAQLYFRGADNTRSHLKWLVDKYNLASADKVVLAGASQGGIAAYQWSTYVRNLMDNPIALYLIVDSGAFINVESPEQGRYVLDGQMKSLYSIANSNQKTPLNVCNRFLLGEQYKCFFLENAWSSIENKVLLINSQYDSAIVPNVLGIKCIKNGTSGSTLSDCNSSQISNMNVYRNIYLNFITNFLQFSKNHVWTIACSAHIYANVASLYDVQAQKVPQSSGLTVRAAIQGYVFEGKRITAIDKDTWPSNKACAY